MKRDNRRRACGIFATVAWILIVIVFSGFYHWPNMLNMPLNEWGDFFAGIFSPVAFFWLILGYLQQGEELKQNTRALEEQAKELRESVKQQQDLARATREEIELTKRRIRPRFHVSPDKQDITYVPQTREGFQLKLEVKNDGGKAVNIKFRISTSQPKDNFPVEIPLNKLNNNDEPFLLPHHGAVGSRHEIPLLFKPLPEALQFSIECENELGDSVREKYRIKLHKEENKLDCYILEKIPSESDDHTKRLAE